MESLESQASPRKLNIPDFENIQEIIKEYQDENEVRDDSSYESFILS